MKNHCNNWTVIHLTLKQSLKGGLFRLCLLAFHTATVDLWYFIRYLLLLP